MRLVLAALGTLKNEWSAEILRGLLNDTWPLPCKTPSMRDEMLQAIWHNECTAYAVLRKEIAQEHKKTFLEFRLDLPEYQGHFQNQ